MTENSTSLLTNAKFRVGDGLYEFGSYEAVRIVEIFFETTPGAEVGQTTVVVEDSRDGSYHKMSAQDFVRSVGEKNLAFHTEGENDPPNSKKPWD